jgi:anti-sigma regulatory factor (Ser/Thr protein kinase)
MQMNIVQRRTALIDASQSSIVALEKFIHSTRDSGYKSTASAISELVDNAIQAKARHVDVTIKTASDADKQDLTIAVSDDGVGMDSATLLQALRFGGSSRYNDRSGMGRFGMGLPNASVGQAERVTVYTQQSDSKTLSTYLDVDEIARGEMVRIPTPKSDRVPNWVRRSNDNSRSGTVVVWQRCDRLDNRRVLTIERKLHQSLGRAFRYFIWNGTIITVNGKAIGPIDPLFLHAATPLSGARVFQEPIILEVYSDPEEARKIGKVEIRFSELPVDAWHNMPNEEKRAYGIANGAGVSIVRAGREVDFGWFFMGSKRRENYDDWWRCEVQFWPELDEAFGITHTKQQIRPKGFLLEALQPIVETTARALNGRVRDAHLRLKSSNSTLSAEHIATTRDTALLPLSRRKASPSDRKAFGDLARRHGIIHQKAKGEKGTFYKLVEDDLPDSSFYKAVHAEGGIITVVNPRHTFYRRLYLPVRDGNFLNPEGLSRALQLLLLAAGRAEASLTKTAEKKAFEKFRRSWSETLDVLLRA